MMKVKDEFGNPIHGLEKSDTGAIVVTDKSAYQQYLHQKQQADKVLELERSITNINQKLDQIVSLLGSKL